MKLRPHIELQVKDIMQKYTWQFYQQNRESIFNGIKISKAGKYALTLRAFDYGPAHETCSTTLNVKDKNYQLSPSGSHLMQCLGKTI